MQSVVERRNTIPILANVVLRAEEGELSLTATDMDMDIATEVGCSVMTAVITEQPTSVAISISISVAVNDNSPSSARSTTLARMGIVLRRSTTDCT